MYFNNQLLSSFGHCKVISWRNSVYADFERKELTYRGKIIAFVEVPTVRKVEAIILVRGRSVAEVQKKLTDIASWLYDAGTAKLFSERDMSHYYNARCTQVSQPEYSGFSARITATFTCSDSRLYAAWNEQPIITATSEMNNFSFDGKHCLNDMGCVFVMESMDAVPEMYANKYEISGMSGTLRYSDGTIRYKERQLSGTLYFVKNTSEDGLMDEAEIMERMHAISSWLANAERALLVLDSDISRQYEAEVINGAALTRKDWENGSIKLKMILQPFASSIETTQCARTLSLTANALTTIDLSELIKNGIGATTPIVVSLTNQGSNNISDLWLYYQNELDATKGMRLNGQEFALSPGETLVVDSLSADVSKDAVSGVKWIKSGDFPVLSVNGTKSIGIKANVAGSVSVVVSCNVRWL